MKKTILTSIIVIMAISTGTAYAGHGKHKYRDNGFYDRARVTHVEPIYTMVRVSVPQQECYTQFQLPDLSIVDTNFERLQPRRAAAIVLPYMIFIVIAAYKTWPAR